MRIGKDKTKQETETAFILIVIGFICVFRLRLNQNTGETGKRGKTSFIGFIVYDHNRGKNRDFNRLIFNKQ